MIRIPFTQDLGRGVSRVSERANTDFSVSSRTPAHLNALLFCYRSGVGCGRVTRRRWVSKNHRVQFRLILRVPRGTTGMVIEYTYCVVTTVHAIFIYFRMKLFPKPNFDKYVRIKKSDRCLKKTNKVVYISFSSYTCILYFSAERHSISLPPN